MLHLRLLPIHPAAFFTPKRQPENRKTSTISHLFPHTPPHALRYPVYPVSARLFRRHALHRHVRRSIHRLRLATAAAHQTSLAYYSAQPRQAHQLCPYRHADGRALAAGQHARPHPRSATYPCHPRQPTAAVHRAVSRQHPCVGSQN